MAERPVVLVADDDDGVRFTLTEILSDLGVEIQEARDGEEAWEKLQAGRVDLLITDLRMPRLDGMELLRRVREAGMPLKVVMITAHGSEAHAVEAMKLGAYDYFKKPFDVDPVVHLVRRATEAARLELEKHALAAELVLARHMVFRSPAMKRVAQIVERVAGRDVTVLIVGESGTGKERVAEALVAASARAGKPFVRFNCAAVPLELAEAELFGHSAGAFTGAARARAGVFREASGGTLFLDEIGELDLAVQSKLLRVLQEGEVKALGEDRVQRVDVRIIAATHRDLLRDVEAGRFREDLYYRLNVVRIEIPPLRDRPEDVPPLIDHFVAKYTDRFGLKGAQLSLRARAELEGRSWRGNVRELENTIERMVALSDGTHIGELGEDAAALPLGLKERVEAFERGLIVEALRAAGGNRSEAARRLGVQRVTLLDKLKKYGLDQP